MLQITQVYATIIHTDEEEEPTAMSMNSQYHVPL
jgi:hypothetical protein